MLYVAVQTSSSKNNIFLKIHAKVKASGKALGIPVNSDFCLLTVFMILGKAPLFGDDDDHASVGHRASS